MSLNYSFVDTLKLLLNSFNYDIFISIIISCIILTIIFIINSEKKIVKYIIIIINLILVFSIFYYYLSDILAFKFNNPINNIYFYFFNSILYLIIMNIFTFCSRKKYINFVFYGISLINILFSLFMTHYLNNITLIVIGNVYPMIKFGNIIYIIYYVFIASYIIDKYLKKI